MGIINQLKLIDLTVAHGLMLYRPVDGGDLKTHSIMRAKLLCGFIA